MEAKQKTKQTYQMNIEAWYVQKHTKFPLDISSTLRRKLAFSFCLFCFEAFFCGEPDYIRNDMIPLF